MENPAPPANPSLCPEVLALLADHPQGSRPSRARQAILMEEALSELERFGPLLEVRLGQVLAPLVRGGHKHLGYVTPAVFCREELGISATAAWDSVRLTEGLLRRPILRQAFLEGRLPRTHALELLRLDSREDAAWVARAAAMSVQELRQVARSRRASPASQDQEKSRVRIYDLEADPYATWLAAVELARRREGRDLGLANVLEQILAEFAAARPLDAPPPFQRAPRWNTTVPAAASDLDSEVAAPAPPPFQRDPRWPATPSPSGGGGAGPGGATPQAANGGAAPGVEAPDPGGAEAGSGLAEPEAEETEPGPPAELPDLLRREIPRSPRKLTFLARRLLASRERLDLQRGRILRRVQEGRLYREAGKRSFRAWLEGRGIPSSTAFQATARDQRLEKHGVLRQALSEGRLSPTKVDLLLRLPRRADVEDWVAYAEGHTCRRLEEAVEAALVLAARFPVTWSHRRGSAPGEEETLEEFRRQAGLQAFEATCEDLAQAFERVDSSRSAPEEVQTSAAPPPAPAPEPSPGANADTSENTEPPPTVRLRLVLPESLDCLLQAAEAHLRRDAGEVLTPEECLYVLCLVFLRQAGSEDSRQGRVRRQALERAGYRCEVPGCTCRTNLHVHHIQRRSQGGSDELPNLAVVCAAHHLRHLHGGTMRVEGEDPVTRIWEMGLQEGTPWRVWCDDRLVDGEALAWEEGDVAPLTAEPPETEQVEADDRLVDGEALAWEGDDDRVCEAVPVYRCGPILPPPETRVA